MTKSINFVLNGQPKSANCRPDTTVLEWLRSEALLRGTKEGCAEGDCGACSVLVERPAVSGNQSNYQAANSCILLMGQLEGSAVMTVEGLAQTSADGHVIQQRMAENGSSQCGFCTPGIVVSLAGLLAEKQSPNESEIHDALAGNLCRCTGYRPIVEAAISATGELGHALPHAAQGDPKDFVGGDNEGTFHLPTKLDDLHSLREKFPDAILLAGGTDISLDVAHARSRWQKTISTRDVTELHVLDVIDDQLIVGGAVSWQAALPHLEKYWPSFATLVRRFGSTQIRSMGTIAGNLATASPIGDGAPSLIALNSSITISNAEGERTIPLDRFFIDYRKCDLKRGEIIKSVNVPLPTPDQQFRAYKISKRYDQDISTVCGAFSISVKENVISNACIAFGGMAATPMRCTAAEEAVIGHKLDQTTLDTVKEAVASTFQPMSDVRGTADYRLLVASNLIERLFLDLSGQAVEVMSL